MITVSVLNWTRCFIQDLKTAHDTSEGWLAALVDAVGIVDIFRAIDGESDKEAVPREEFTPGFVQQRAVGLEGVVDSLPFSISSAAIPGRARKMECPAMLVRRPARQS